MNFRRALNQALGILNISLDVIVSEKTIHLIRMVLLVVSDAPALAALMVRRQSGRIIRGNGQYVGYSMKSQAEKRNELP
jgi:hypothetical protein